MKASWFKFGECELVNHSMLRDLIACGGIGDGVRVEVNCVCDLERLPPCFGDTPRYWTTPDQMPTPEVPNPSSVPWFNSAYPESAEFLGAALVEVAGWDSGLTRRPTLRVGGGSLGGPAIIAGKELVLSLRLYATTERGMRYGFRWLSDNLTGEGCNNTTAEIRTTCDASGYWLMRGVTVLEAPQEKRLQNRSTCHVMPVEFSVLVEQPWLSKCPEVCAAGQPEALPHSCACPAECSTPEDCSHYKNALTECDSCATHRVCCAISPSGLGKEAALVVLTSGEFNGPAVRIGMWAGDCPPSCDASPLTELITSPIPPFAELAIDSATRTVTLTDLLTGATSDGSNYLVLSEAYSHAWLDIDGCDDVCLCVEVNGFCSASRIDVLLATVHQERIG